MIWPGSLQANILKLLNPKTAGIGQKAAVGKVDSPLGHRMGGGKFYKLFLPKPNKQQGRRAYWSAPATTLILSATISMLKANDNTLCTSVSLRISRDVTRTSDTCDVMPTT